MIPIRDTIPSKNYPVVNNTIIGLNVVIYLLQLAQGTELDRFIFMYGLVPARYSVPQISDYFSTGQQLFALLSFMFLHGGFWHLLGNMWSLYIFGDNVEDRMGRISYFFFFIISGLIASFTHYMLYRSSTAPAIGASGAISGVMAAYMFLFPRSKILSFVPVFFIPLLIPIPAFIFIAIWFIGQVFNGTYTLLFSPTATGIAFWAHIGGFLGGLLLYRLFLSRKRKRKKKNYKY